jgi:TolB-like protein/AraC-like DNA-binding protein
MFLINRKFRLVLLLLFALILLVYGWYQFGYLNSESKVAPKRPSIAVLPFEDMSSGKDQEYFGNGIAEEILNTLANLQELNVIGRTSSFSFKGKNLTIEEIGKALKVDHILEGSVRKIGNKIRITSQLIKVSDGFHLLSQKYERELEDVFKIQDEIAQNIGEELLKKLTPEQTQKLKFKNPPNSEAYRLFLRAKYIHDYQYFGNYNLKDFELSKQLFLKAIELDSNYALAYAGLADLYDTHKHNLTDTVELKRYDFLKIKYSERAWQLNPDLPYVNIVRGWVMRNKKVEPNDMNLAYSSFLRGYQLNPNSSDGLFGLAYFFEDKSLLADADKLLDKIIELEPLRSSNYSVKADFLMRSGQYESAIKVALSALTINPNDLYALSNLAMNYAFLNKREKALEIYNKIFQIDSSYINNSIIDKKMYALMRGDIMLARDIPTSKLDYRGENVIINSIIGDVDSIESSFLKWWDWYKKFLTERAFSEYSSYLELRDNNIYSQIRNKSWFQDILKAEKEKYDRFFAKFPRAESILLTTKGDYSKENDKTTIFRKYSLLLFLILIIGFAIYLIFLEKNKQEFKKENKNQAVILENTLEIEVNNKPDIAENKMVDPFLQKLEEIMDKNMTKSNFGLPQLCKALGMSRAQLYRKIKETTGTSPALYIRRLRLLKAKKLLQSTNLNITEAAYEVGFKDLSYFSRSFLEEFGENPSETRK